MNSETTNSTLLATQSPGLVRKRSAVGVVIEHNAKEAAAVVDAEKRGSGSRSIEDKQPRLTFYQRYFCRPITRVPTQHISPADCRFSFFSIGVLLCFAVLVILLILVLPLAVILRPRGHTPIVYRNPANYSGSPISDAVTTNFADPFILHYDDTWYAYATQDLLGVRRQPHNETARDYSSSNVQLATSSDFVTWTLLNNTYDPLPELGTWAKRGLTPTKVPNSQTWAPAILQRPSDGAFVLYYSALAANTTRRRHCVGAAISTTSSPAGPYTALNTTISCPKALGGSIDPYGFIDTDDAIYVAWKVDGNAAGHGGICGNTHAPQKDTPIMLQRMQADGITPSGPARAILHRTAADGPLVEAPSIIRSDAGVYFLFFSSGCTYTDRYDVKYATASNVTGPYTRAAQPLLQTGSYGLVSPGSATVAATTAEGGWVMAFHANVMSGRGRIRAMFTTGIVFNGTVATLVPISDEL